MDIKDKITEWHNYYVINNAGTDECEIEMNKELELVLSAIDTLTKPKEK